MLNVFHPERSAGISRCQQSHVQTAHAILLPRPVSTLLPFVSTRPPAQRLHLPAPAGTHRWSHRTCVRQTKLEQGLLSSELHDRAFPHHPMFNAVC